MAKRKKPKTLWAQLCDAMLVANDRKAAEAVAAKMVGDERKQAERWLYGPTAAQKRESAERQRAINATTEAEIRTHCQTEGL